jgi:hypothetical protein
MWRLRAADDRHAAAEMSYFPNPINVEGYPSGSIVAPECWLARSLKAD